MLPLTDFDAALPIDHKTVQQSLLDIDERKRTSRFAWKGQFSPQFVEAMLREFTTCSTQVYDPFAGSGTVLSESIGMHLAATGVELNPAAYIMSCFNRISNEPAEERYAFVAEVDDALPRLVSAIEARNVADVIACLSPRASDLAALLIVLCDIYNHDVTYEFMCDKWLPLKSEAIFLPYTERKIDCIRADSRNVPLESLGADLVLTSPPYINVINYHQQYRRSVEALGYDVLYIAKAEFGSNRKNRGNRFLTVTQYVIDMAFSIRETLRLCNDGARLVYVVGKESTVLGCSFSNSWLIYAIFNMIYGIDCDKRQQRVFTNRFGTRIFEDVLHFVKPKTLSVVDDDRIETVAKDIARASLNNALTVHGADITDARRELLESAIVRVDEVKGSEIR